MRRKFNRKLDMQARFTRARRRNMVDATPGVHPCILILDGLKPDFNIGKIFRAADAFSIREIHLINVEFFDPEPAKGSVRWVPFIQHEDFSSCYRTVIDRGYSCILLEPGQHETLDNSLLPKRAAFVLGHEEFGFSFEKSEYNQMASLAIPQWGYVQSLNVSVAASIVLYEYVRQHGKPPAGEIPRQPVAIGGE